MSKNNIKKIILLFVLTSGIFLLVFLAEAAIPPPSPSPSSIDNPLSSNSFTELAGNIIDWITNIGIAIAVIMIIYSGFLFMTSGGDQEKVTKARKALTWSLIGLAVLIIGKGFVSIVEKLLGVSS